jgi:MFS family permease
MLVLSPISGVLADRHGSRALATIGMLVTAVGLGALATIRVDTPYWQLALYQLIVGAGSGLFNSPNTSAVLGVVPPAKRGVGAGTRMMLVQSGFVISIALSIGLVTSSMDPHVMLRIFSGSQTGASGINLGPFVDALRVAFGVGALVSLVGAGVSLMRGDDRSWQAASVRASSARSTTAVEG